MYRCDHLEQSCQKTRVTLLGTFHKACLGRSVSSHRVEFPAQDRSGAYGVGIIGTGLLAVPILAASAAYAIGEAYKWPIGLSREPKEAVEFYSTLTAAAVLGIGITLSPIDPIKALYWSAVINGVVAVPVMTVMMLMTAKAKVMGKFVITGWPRWLGWVSTLAMGACVVGMIVGWFL